MCMYNLIKKLKYVNLYVIICTKIVSKHELCNKLILQHLFLNLYLYKIPNKKETDERQYDTNYSH